MSIYNKLTLASYKKRLADGRYLNITGARRALGRIADVTDSERAKGREAIKKYFEKTPSKKKSKKQRIKRATTNAFKKEAPFCVTFAKTVQDRDASELLLNFLRGAADSGMTLPDLIGAIEAV